MVSNSKTKNPDKVKKGRISRAAGKAFEIRVRADLESKGFICDRWTNNLECYQDTSLEYRYKIVPAKPHMVFNPVIKRRIPQQTNSGFPDYLCMRRLTGKEILEMMKNDI